MMPLSRMDMLLLHYAAGRLHPAYMRFVLLWLAVDPEARRRVAEFEALGGLVLEEVQVVEISVQSFEIVMRRIDDDDSP